MKSKILPTLALAIALIAGELQAQVIFDNQGPSPTLTSFGGGTGFPASLSVVGDDFDTIAPPSPDGKWLVDSVDFAARIFPEIVGEISTYNDIQVEVSLVDLGDISVMNEADNNNGNYTAADFGSATVLGSEVFTLGRTGTFGVSQTITVTQTVNFTNPIDIGDGIGTGIIFTFSDSTNGSELGLLSVGYRNNGTPEPLIGITSDRNYRDGLNNGTINTAFGFSSDIGLAYTVNATAADEFVLGDVDLDGTVSFLDISPFIALLSSNGFLDEADIDRDGMVTFLDISPFIAILSGQ